MAMKCSICGRTKPLTRALTGSVTEMFSGEYVCDECRHAKDREHSKKAADADEKVVVTTTNHIDGYLVRKYLGIESVEFVLGTGFFSEVASNAQDFWGLRSSGFEKKLQEAKQTALTILKMRAAEKGANAIIGVDLDYTEFSGNRIGLIINGTLVRLVPDADRPVADGT